MILIQLFSSMSLFLIAGTLSLFCSLLVWWVAMIITSYMTFASHLSRSIKSQTYKPCHPLCQQSSPGQNTIASSACVQWSSWFAEKSKDWRKNLLTWFGLRSSSSKKNLVSMDASYPSMTDTMQCSITHNINHPSSEIMQQHLPCGSCIHTVCWHLSVGVPCSLPRATRG